VLVSDDMFSVVVALMIVMDSQGRLGKILVGMNRALGESESLRTSLTIAMLMI
jgi:hypothetical protein